MTLLAIKNAALWLWSAPYNFLRSTLEGMDDCPHDNPVCANGEPCEDCQLDRAQF